MRYFILQQDKKIIDISEYLKCKSSNLEFSRFVRREALGEILVEQSNAKPGYLSWANKFGFRWEPNADIGHVQYDYKANLMRRLVQDYARQLVQGLGLPIYEVNGANMFNMRHPVVKAYASLFGDRLYQFKSGDHDVVMSYDASYPQFNLAAKRPLSHKQLPFAHFSISDCYRHEQSGEMMLLLRQRRFFMPDIHPYFKDIAEAFDWFPKLQAKIVEAAVDVGRNYQVVIEVPSEAIWDKYRGYIERIAGQFGADVLVNIVEDGHDHYWVINVDYKIVDKLGQVREIGCIQVDIGNAPRLDIYYIDSRGQKQYPVIIHSAIPGGIERYLYLALDNFGRQGLPLWLYPVQLRLLPVSSGYVKVCQKLVNSYAKLPLRIEIDDRSVGVAAKLKLAHEDLVPHQVVIGKKEVDEQFANLEKLVNQLAERLAGKPFIRREWPAEVSRQLI